MIKHNGIRVNSIDHAALLVPYLTNYIVVRPDRTVQLLARTAQIWLPQQRAAFDHEKSSGDTRNHLGLSVLADCLKPLHCLAETPAEKHRSPDAVAHTAACLRLPGSTCAHSAQNHQGSTTLATHVQQTQVLL